MKVELTVAEADRSLHPHHTELWVRVLTNDPIGPQDWDKIRVLDVVKEGIEGYSQAFCQFYATDDLEEKDHEYGFEQWYILPSLYSKVAV